MNWDDLRLFLVVSRHAKLEEAAAVLRMDATTISRRLRRLESAIGDTLFERTRHGHILTSRGEDVARQAEAMETSWLSIEESGQTRQSVSGRVRLGVTEGLGAALIAPSMRRLAVEWPSLEVDLIALSGFVSVPKREADMSILLTRPQSGRLKIRRLADYTLHLYGSRNYLEKYGPIRSRAELQDHTLIGYVDDLIYSPQLRYFDEVLPGLHPQFASPSILAQLEMTRAGTGLCILPRFLASTCQELQVLLENDIRVERTFWLVVHEDVASFARIRVINDCVTDIMDVNQARLYAKQRDA
ncbi:MAG: LysR family transcriptional regulator [Henriciella sp.]